MGNIISTRYATSLFELAVEENILEQVAADMQALAMAVLDEPDFLPVLEFYAVTNSDRDRFISNIFEGRFHHYSVDILHMLVQKGHIREIGGLPMEFARLYRERMNITTATATTAIPLSSELKEKLTQKLQQLTGKTIELTNVVDENVVGGILLNVEGEQMDGSLKGRIEGIRKAINSAII